MAVTGKYTNKLQACLTYEGSGFDPGQYLDGFLDHMRQRRIPLTVMEQTRSAVRLMSPDPSGLHLYITYFGHPADPAVFESALASPITNMFVPDARERIFRQNGHILIEVHHGVLGSVSDNPKYRELLVNTGHLPGATMGEFNMRVDVLAEACRHLIQARPATLVHWTQSNLLLRGEMFASFADQSHPGLLTVRPALVGDAPVPGFEETPVGFFTIGAADYIGREIYVTPAPVPWVEQYEAAITFMRVILMRDGYVIPDGDSFGIETGEFSYRVNYLSPEDHPAGVNAPLYALKLMFSQAHGYTTMEYETRTKIDGGIKEATKQVEPDERDEIVSNWEERDRLLKSKGGRLDLYNRGQDVDPPPGAAPARQGFTFGKRAAVFGRRH